MADVPGCTKIGPPCNYSIAPFTDADKGPGTRTSVLATGLLITDGLMGSAFTRYTDWHTLTWLLHRRHQHRLYSDAGGCIVIRRFIEGAVCVIDGFHKEDHSDDR